MLEQNFDNLKKTDYRLFLKQRDIQNILELISQTEEYEEMFRDKNHVNYLNQNTKSTTRNHNLGVNLSSF